MKAQTIRVLFFTSMLSMLSISYAALLIGIPETMPGLGAVAILISLLAIMIIKPNVAIEKKTEIISWDRIEFVRAGILVGETIVMRNLKDIQRIRKGNLLMRIQHLSFWNTIIYEEYFADIYAKYL